MPISTYKEVTNRIEQLEIPFNKLGVDPFGISRWHLTQAATIFYWLYHNYFSVKVTGIGNIPKKGRAMLVGNHSGGIPLDAMMVVASIFVEMKPTRLVQGMVEKFMNRWPFVSQWANRLGQFTGLPEHAVRLLEDDRLVLVFPEGARGTAKLYPNRNSLVQFGTGFMRLALQTESPIVPFAVIGGGEAVPTFFNAHKLGRALGAPYIPITPYLVPLPLPVRIDVLYGEPMTFAGKGSEDDDVIARYIGQVKERVTALIEQGIRIRKGEVLPESAPPAEEKTAGEGAAE